ncbi:carbohydrate ABC transporter permease [Brachybacterium sacelli]|uniref:Multiple sugar transport system permease protein n=1 Tax=Brachybacterium sacelli TaxID=173364 RepID=A0ABS4X0J8_9MICO|nr:carbohydrate ABC transporter permease [Brachybacterium sacelli]MBP2381988.1 multiple sugar transport system permease protein [Brachybacterium sacelli]
MTDTTADRTARRPRVSRSERSKAVNLVLLLLATIVVLFPFLWMVSLAFTPAQDAFREVKLWPDRPTFENFMTALTVGNLGRAFVNSVIVALAAVASNCVIAVAAGYAFAHLPFRGSTVVFYILLSTAAIPVAVTLIPLFLMVSNVPFAGGNDALGRGGSGLTDTLGGLAIPYLVGTLSIFLVRQFYLGMSRELAEAARIDGASEFRIFWTVYLPISRPIIAVVAIFSFTAVWDDLLWPLVVSSSPRSQTVQLALTGFTQSGNIQYAPLMAAAIIVTLPVLLVFLFNQRHFISGLSEGAVKG